MPGFEYAAPLRPRIRLPQITYPEALPISAKRKDIIRAIGKYPVVVITGETGSGKTTQIPKMCIEAGRGRKGMIGCTQPRRVAAVTVAQRIAEELGEDVGNTVGYKIRFEERLGRRPVIKIMTDGVLLMETRTDPLLRRYDTLIVDEAHERSLNIDFVLGILRILLPKRPDLKVVITSATIDTEKFSQAFQGAPIIEVSGRMYPVEVRYRPVDLELEEAGELTYVDASIRAVDDIRSECREGDMLIFMPREQDIREACDLLAGRGYEDALVLPLFARLSGAEQHRVFQRSSLQKIIVATNVAETSITIPGIRYVIDTGLARLLQYNPRSRTTGLPVKKISKSSAEQRKGRCGRVQDGICIRLYDEESYDKRPLFTPPEIQRANLAEVILRMLSLGLGDVASFPFIDPPPVKNIHDGIEVLQELGAIAGRRKEDPRGPSYPQKLTKTGRMMAELPVDPRVSRMVIEAAREGCLDEVVVIASGLSIQDPRDRPAEKEVQADQMHAVFKDPTSDFITLLNIWRRYHTSLESLKSQGQMRRFCKDHFLSYRRMREWRDVHEQITAILAGQQKAGDLSEKPRDLYAAIHKAILSGYLSQIAVKKEKNLYTAAKGKEVMIFPASSLFNHGGQWIVAAELVETSRLFARTSANIDSAWLEAIGGDLCRSSYSEPRWSSARGEVVACEQVSLFGLVIVPRRPVSYGPIDPDEASRIFVRSALVEGDLKKPFPFVLHNQKLVADVAGMEDKLRRHDLLVSEDMMAQFYETKLHGIYDVRTLQKLIRERGGDDFLRMRQEDVLLSEPDQHELALYPEEVKLGRIRLSCAYRFDPSQDDDGLTVRIPVHLASAVSPSATEWLVPGLLREKIMALIRGLSKELRKKLQPLSQTCDIIMAEMAPEDIPLHAALGKFIQERFGLHIPAAAWPESLDEHLRMRLAIVDARGQELAASRDIHILQNESGAASAAAMEKAKKRWEKTNLTAWDFDDLPEWVVLADGSLAFPALEAAEHCVHVRLFSRKREAEVSHRGGIMALYGLHFQEELKYLKKSLALSVDMKPWAEGFGGVKSLEHIFYGKVCRDLFDIDIRTRDEFFLHAWEIRPRIMPRGQEIMEMARPILKAHHETLALLKRLGSSHRFNKPALRYLTYLREELDRLVPRHFLEPCSRDRMVHTIRYLKALVVRAERGLLHLEKAFLKTEEIKKLTDSWAVMRNELPTNASQEKRRAIEQYGWMIEEYKVSVFAQELKTAIPVSRKRLEEKWREIERMV